MFNRSTAADGTANGSGHGARAGTQRHSVTIVIPFKWGWIKPDALLRLAANCLLLRRLEPAAKVAIADGSVWKMPARILAGLLGMQHIPVASPAYYSPAQVKNAAARQIANTRYLLFLDVDVVLTQAAWHRLHMEMHGNTQFTWLPVIFLDRNQGTLKMLAQALPNAAPPEIVARVQIGYSTGIQLIDRRFFDALGGYKSDFEGYGCEDIEMIHRATGVLSMRPLFGKDAEYYRDVRSHHTENLGGFRKFFYEMRKDVPLDAMPVHFWHKRKNKSDYMLQRKKNDIFLHQVMTDFDTKHLDQNGGMPVRPSDSSQF